MINGNVKIRYKDTGTNKEEEFDVQKSYEMHLLNARLLLIVEGLQEVDEENSKKLLKCLDNNYYSSKGLVQDEVYDKYKNYVLSKYNNQNEYSFVPGEDLQSNKNTIKHSVKILSLEKINKEEDLIKSIKRLMPCIIEPKFDGMTGVAYPRTYGKILTDNKEKFHTNINEEDDKVIPYIVGTRGDGYVGTNITDSVDKMNKLHYAGILSIAHPIRFEIFMRKSVLAEINKERMAEGMTLFENTRNATSGIINSGDEELLQKLDYIAYNILDTDISETDQLNLLYKKRINIPTVNACMKVEKEEDIPKALEFIKNYDRDALDYDIDGLVIKANYKDSYNKLGGATEHHPKNAVAWKFPTENKWSRLKDVKYQVGRTGKITPVAIIEPVKLYGTVVHKATLNNYKFVQLLNLKTGSLVQITKANEIIPRILSSKDDEKTSSNIIKPLNKCPVCGGEIKNINGVQYCINPSCKNKLIFLVNHLASKKCLNIESLADKTIEKLIDLGLIKVFTDIFDLTKEDLLLVDGFKAKKANKVFKNIQNARVGVSLDKFIYAAGIENVGLRASREIANTLKTFANFVVDLNNNCSKIRTINNIGDEISNSLINSKNRFGLLFKYINPVDMPEHSDVPEINTATNESYSIAITGTLSRSRSYYENLITSHGCKFSSSVTSKTDYLVVGNNPGGNKYNNALKYNTTMVEESDLLRILNL